MGFKDITTVEYNVPDCNHPNIKCISYLNEFKKEEEEYDYIITFSSIEHSGLGRYGDNLNPNGDLEAMDDIYKSLKKDGILILGIPIGGDALVWNVHRNYGKIRYPMLISKFEELEWIHYNKDTQLKKGASILAEQPVVVLKKKDNDL